MPDILEAPAETEPEMTQERICRICGQGELETFFDAADIPVQLNVLWSKRAEALECTKGHIRLAFCRKCGCIRNVTFEPELLRYDVSYENSLHFSPVFQEYAQALAIDLVGRYDLHGKVVVEIGCGKGEFLAMLCEHIDPRMIHSWVHTHGGPLFFALSLVPLLILLLVLRTSEKQKGEL